MITDIQFDLLTGFFLGGVAVGIVVYKIFVSWQVQRDAKVRSLTHQLQDADQIIGDKGEEITELEKEITELRNYKEDVRSQVVI